MPIKINGTNTAANPSITGTDTDTGIVYGSDQMISPQAVLVK